LLQRFDQFQHQLVRVADRLVLRQQHRLRDFRRKCRFEIANCATGQHFVREAVVFYERDMIAVGGKLRLRLVDRQAALFRQHVAGADGFEHRAQILVDAGAKARPGRLDIGNTGRSASGKEPQKP